MGRITTALVLIAAVYASRVLASQAVLQSTSKTEGSGASKALLQTFELGNEAVSFGMTYDISTPDGTPPGKCFSRQSVFRSKIVPLGMTSGKANWYSQGFFSVRVDGESIHDSVATFKIVRSGGADALLEGVWPTSKGPVSVRFCVRGGDDKLLMQVDLPSETKAEKLELVFLCYPQSFEKPHERHMATATRDVPSTPKLTLDGAGEPWALYYDAGIKGARPGSGPCGLVYAPAEVASAEVNLGPYAVHTRLTTKPGARKLTVGLWDFTGIGDAPTMIEYLKRDGGAIAADLQAVARTDWPQAVLPPPQLGAFTQTLARIVERREQPTAYDEMTSQVVTPHLACAKPLAGGPVRLLMVAPRWRQRETVELAQRLDMQYETVSFGQPDALTDPEIYLYGSYDLYGYPRKTAAAVLNELQRKLEAPRDCIILTGFQPKLIPEHLLKALFEKVRAGTGLILLGQPSDLLTAVKDELLPAEWTQKTELLQELPVLRKMLAEKKPIWSARSLGKGRVLAFHYGTGRNALTPSLSMDDPDVAECYDQYMRLVISSVLWACGRDGATLNGPVPEAPAKPGANPVSLELRGNVLRPGEKAAGVVRLASVPPHAVLDIELWDALGRLIHRQRLHPSRDDAEVPFEFEVGRTPAILHEVRGRLMAPDGKERLSEIGSAAARFSVVDRTVDDFHFLVWADGDNNALAQNILRVLAEHGVDWIDNTGVMGCSETQAAARCRNAARFGLRSIPYITRINSEQLTGRVRQPCLSDPQWQEKWTAGLRERARGASLCGPPGYTLGDENYLVSRAQLDVCISPTCLAGFRAWLQQRYPSLDALNASWQTAYARWDDVAPATFEEVRPKPAQWPRWAEHRLYMDGVFAAAHSLGRQAIREGDPGARVGFDGLYGQDSWHGYNFYQLCQACDLVQVYALHFMQVEYLRSWKQADAICGAWYNELGNRSELWAKRMGWYLLFHGFNSSWYWTSYNTGPALLFPDLRPTPQFLWMAQTHAEISGGVGKLLLHARRQHDSVAIHYSQASLHATTLMGRSVERSQEGFARIIEDLGLQYNMLSSEQIEQGELKGYKVLVLPASVALSELECRALTSFVEHGGLLLADTVPGILDGHCRLLDKGLVDSLFGVTRSGLPTRGTTEKLAIAHDELSGEIPMLTYDTNLKAETAAPWGLADKTPVALVKSAGKGHAVVLNAAIEQYDSLRKVGNTRLMRQLTQRMLDLAGVQPQVRILADGTPLDACETVRFIDGKIEYLGIIYDQDCAGARAQEVTIEFPNEAHVYDVRAGQPLGCGRKIATRLVSGEPKVLARLPYSVAGITVRPRRVSVTAGGQVELHVTLDTGRERLAGRHCLRVEAIAPEPWGKLSSLPMEERACSLKHYAQNVLTQRAETDVEIDLALNDAPGTWQFRTTDVATGCSDTTNVTVTQEQE